MADSAAIDAALIAKLEADAALRAVLPDGVFYGLAPQNAHQFVLVSLVETEDVGEFGRCAYEDALYMVKAVALGTNGSAAKTGAQRIHELLEDQPLEAAGYGFMKMHREGRIRASEPDEIDAAIVWQHRGGNYRVQMAIV